MRRSLLALALLFVLSQAVSAQPIARPYPFEIIPLDTNSSEYLDALVPPARELTATDRIKLSADGHLVDQSNQRVRLFGTSLWYTAQFLPQNDAKMLAVRLRKLGFNAVKLVYNDFFGWDDASFFKTYTDDWSAINPSSYEVNAVQLARFDTLLYELKRNGIYSIITLNGSHNYSHGDGVRNWDSTYSGAGLHHFWDTTAQRLQMQWAARLLTHTNPLTGLRLINDPMIAYVGFNQEHSLYFWWQLDRLNYIDEANKLNRGTSTISYGDSKRLDTLFNRYLLKKYSSQPNLEQAWGGDKNPPKNNLLDNGSFENFNSPAWTFSTSGGANAGQLISDGGIDSSVYVKLKINGLGSNPVYNNIVLYNLSPRLGKDTLYELTFWAKMGYDANRPAITARSMGVLVFAYNNNAVGLNANDVIDTAWKKYSFTFRTTGSGVHYVYLYFGTDLGDVWLDAFDLHRKAETPLLAHENLSSLKIDRLKYALLPNYPLPRTRDMVMFYDSLERGFYSRMQAHLKTNGYEGLVNWTQTQWYSMLPDIYKASGGDIAEHHTGWDYMSQRPNMTYSDSTWMVRNTPMVKSLYGGTLNNISANLVAGKANILGDYQVPWMNQYHTEHLVLLPALASYQDMDGIFFGPYAIFRDELRGTKLPNQFASEGAFGSIANNPAIASLLPAASYAFRSGAIKPASVDDTIQHDPNDVWLYPLHGANRGYHGVEGYLDPNAATAFRMRQQFNSKTHRVAAE
ncbi:MAG TPA: carbohydrate binding domain-containing protein, partial [Candidatus Kapabacteria bacterium]|nr:carbohydrate binding domain-containing protein [Candidatus Kapabacteria bacterium]